NAVYTLGGPFDDDVASLGGAMYVADVLRTLAARQDILMANYWSMTGNGPFGAVSNRKQLRPAYQVLTAYSAIMHGRLVDLQIDGPAFDAPAVGAVPATRSV